MTPDRWRHLFRLSCPSRQLRQLQPGTDDQQRCLSAALTVDYESPRALQRTKDKPLDEQQRNQQNTREKQGKFIIVSKERVYRKD